MNWNLLRSLISVQKHGGVRKAARKMGITQPALSSQLRHLEEQLGAELFQRKGREITINQLGQKAADAGHRMMEIYDTLGAEIRAATTGRSESLRLAVERDLDRTYFVQMVSRVLDRLDPKPVHIRIQAEFDAPIREELRNGRIDFAFTSEGPEQFGLEPILTIPLPVVFVGAPKWQTVFSRLSKSAEDAEIFSHLTSKNIPMIYPSSSVPLHAMTRSFLENIGVTGSREIELWPMTAVTSGVAEGLGVSFLPLHFIGRSLQAGEVTILCKRSWNWGLNLYCYKSPIIKGEDSPTQQAILDTFEAEQANLRKFQFEMK